MLKVLIADDEKKVCRLIHMLCDWDALGMEIVGDAYNGIEALEMAKQHTPDILITDVRMPGCDGIELIEQVRELLPSIEILIVSGYADFKYAQSALRFGVSDYLLKPIKKNELEATLGKLGERCLQEQARKKANVQLMRFIENDNQRKRCSFFPDVLLAGQKKPIADRETLNREYGYHFVQGVYRVLILKADYDPDRYSPQAVQKIMENMNEILRSALEGSCSEFELWQDRDLSYMICNYTEEDSHLFRKAVRTAVDRIGMKRFQLWSARYSVAMGPAVKETGKLYDSLNGAMDAIKERLLEGCEKLLEPLYAKAPGEYSDLANDFKASWERGMASADEKIIKEAVEALKAGMLSRKNVSGRDLLSVVNSLGLFLISGSSMAEENQNEKIDDFLRRCSLCSDPDQLFEALEMLAQGILEAVRKQNEEETSRPIRQAKQYILNHYTEPITLEMVAERARFSSSYFSNLFKRETGTGFNEYVTKLRIERAKELLKNTGKNVKDVCTEVGYSDLKHFTAVFRKYTGLKPGEFRKLYG